MTQSERVLKALGGAYRLAGVFKLISERPREYSVMLRWTYSKEKRGTGGFIPSCAWPDIFLAADFLGVKLSSKLLDPRPDNEPLEKEAS